MMWLKYLAFRFGSRDFRQFGIEAIELKQGGMVISYYPKDCRLDTIIEAIGEDAKRAISSQQSLIYGIYLPKMKMYDLFKICVRINKMRAFS